MARRVAFIIVAWICLTCAGVAQTLTFPPLTGRVVDEAGLLSSADIAALNGVLGDLEAKTTDQLVVVTLKSLQGTTIEDYGYQLGRRWKIGQKDKDSGVLMIVVASQKKVRIEVGYGLEGTLTDAATRVIIENSILPRFKTGDFPGGIRSGVADIVQMLVGDAARPRPGPAQPAMGGNRGDANTAVWPGIVLGLAGVGLLIFCAVTGGGGACRAIMQILFVIALSGRGGGSSRGKSNFSGGGGSFGGGGSSGSW
jgi:uncharacterized protein